MLAVRIAIEVVSTAIIAVLIAAVACAQPISQPSAKSTSVGKSAAALAIQKDEHAAKKAAEASKSAAEASKAATEAAALAVKAVSGAAASPAVSAPAADPSITLITDSSPQHRDEAAKSVQAVNAMAKGIDRDRLSNADAENYELASNLLTNARKALAENQYLAATSLSHKAQILLSSIHAN